MPKDDDPKKEGEVNLEDLQKQVQTLADSVTKIGEAMGQLPAAISTSIAKSLESVQTEKKGDPKPDPDPDEADLERLSRKDFSNFLVQKISKEVIDPLAARLDEGDKQGKLTDLNRQVEEAKKKYSDFDEFFTKEGMGAILKGNPSLSIDDAYQLAKARDPEKVKALQDKAKKEEEEKKAKEEDDESQIPQGFFPTSGKPPEGKREGESRKDLMNRKFDELFGKGDIAGGAA